MPGRALSSDADPPRLYAYFPAPPVLRPALDARPRRRAAKRRTMTPGVRHGRHPPLCNCRTKTADSPSARFFRGPRHRPRPVLARRLLPRRDALAVQLQVATGARLALEVLEHLGACQIPIAWAVPGPSPRMASFAQVPAQPGVGLQRARRTSILRLETAPRDGRVRPRGTDVVREYIIMGHHMALLGMIPAPPDVLDPLALMRPQHLIEGHAPPSAVARLGHLVPPGQPAIMQCRNVPLALRQPAVQARLVRREGQCPVDATPRLVCGHDQAGQIRSNVAAGRFRVNHTAEDLDASCPIVGKSTMVGIEAASGQP